MQSDISSKKISITPRPRAAVLAIVLLFLCLWAMPSTGRAAPSGLYSQDPMVRISSLPVNKDIDQVLAGVSADVAKQSGIAQEYVTYYWQTIRAVNCMGKKTTDHPVFVDLYVPGFFTDKKIALMMNSIAAALEKNLGIDRKWVFIHTHFPGQGHVYISGRVETWKDYQGQGGGKK